MKNVGLNWTLIGLFLFFLIVYGAFGRSDSRAEQSGGRSGVEQSGGGCGGGCGADVGGTAETPSPPSPPPVPSEESETEKSPDSRCVVSRAGVPDDSVQATTDSLKNTCGSDIRNPQYPVAGIPTKDNEQNLIDRQRRLIREYQSYIKSLRGQCCRRVHSGRNLLDNALSNKNYEVRPMIANGGDSAMYLQTDDFSNIMTLSPDEADKYRVSFYDQEPAPPRTYALQASENWPMYQRTFDRSFVTRIPDPPNLEPFKVVPWMDWPGDAAYCPASRACGGIRSPPWSTKKAYTCQGLNFNKPRAPEPEALMGGRDGQPPPYIPPGEAPPGRSGTPRTVRSPAAPYVPGSPSVPAGPSAPETGTGIPVPDSSVIPTTPPGVTSV